MRLRDRITEYLYPIIIVIIILTVIFLFFYLATFISGIVDTALEQEQKTQTKELAIEAEAYEAATKPEEIPLTHETYSTTTTNETTTSLLVEEKPQENKALITISVLNSTAMAGKAGELSSLLASQGYKVLFVGNEKKQQPTTLIKVKDTSKKIFPVSISEITNIVKSIYTITEVPLEATSEYDLVIVIGMS